MDDAERGRGSTVDTGGDVSFLDGIGMAALMRAYDWRSAGLGPPGDWSADLKRTTALVLRCPLPMALLWGADGILIYNDAYAALSGSKHPRVLGMPAREAWDEVAGFVDHLMGTCLSGQSLSFRDHELVLAREGKLEHAWLNLDYWCVSDACGRPTGVMAIVGDTTEKVLAQRRLSGERERLAQLFDQAPSFMAMVEGPEHRFTLANPNYVQLVGHRDVLGRPIAESLPDVASQGYVSVLDEVYRSGRTFRAEGAAYGLQTVVGGPVQMRQLDFVLQPVRDQDDQVSGVFIEGVDVTARHEAQQDLARAMRRQKLLFDIVLKQRTSASTGEALQVAAAMSGDFFEAGRADFYRVAEDGGMAFEPGWRPHGPSVAGVAWKAADLGPVLQVFEGGQTLVFDDATRHPVASASILPRAGMIAGVGVPIVRDGAWRAGFILSSGRARGWSCDDVTLIEEVVQLTWDAVERIQAKLDLEVANHGLQGRVAQALREQAQTEEILWQAQRTESTRLLAANELLLQANRELAVSRDAAHVASRAKGAFLANMSHEIRTPLNGILGLTHLLAQDPRDHEQADRLALIRSSGQHLLRVLNDVLDLSKIEAGKLELQETAFALPGLLSGTVAMIEDLAQAKGLRLIVESVDFPDPLIGDATRLSQVLLNLLTNAVKFTEAGSVRLSCSVAATAARAVTIRFEVRDTGVGIARDVQASLFMAFEQGDSSSTRRHGGTGLGLALTQKIVHAMGGEVGMRSTPGVGSAFWATLEVRRAAPARLPEATGPDPASRTLSVLRPRRAVAPDDIAELRAVERSLKARHAGQRILVAEDDLVNQIVIRELLGCVGLVVEIAEDGLAALELATTRDYGLIFMDVQMPRMDGLEATRQLLARSARPPPVIAMTAHAFIEDRAACFDAGMSDHVAKPVQPAELYAKLLQWLPKSASASMPSSARGP